MLQVLKSYGWASIIPEKQGVRSETGNIQLTKFLFTWEAIWGHYQWGA